MKKKISKLFLNVFLTLAVAGGLIYLIGFGYLVYFYIKPIPAEKPAIEPGLPAQAYYDLGVRFEKGEGAEKNLQKAGAYFGRAAALRTEAARQHLAQSDASCDAAMAADTDDLDSCILFAGSGDLETQLALAARYETRGNKEEARKWWLEAAKQGHVFSQYAVLRTVADGTGMPDLKDLLHDPGVNYLTMAYGWLCVLEKQAHTPGSPGLEMWRESGLGNGLRPLKAELDKEAGKFIKGMAMRKMCRHYIQTYYKEPGHSRL